MNKGLYNQLPAKYQNMLAEELLRRESMSLEEREREMYETMLRGIELFKEALKKYHHEKCKEGRI